MSSYRINAAKTIVDKFIKARELAKAEKLVLTSTDSRSILIPLILMAPVFYYFGGTEDLFLYGKFILINIISAHVAFAFFFVIEAWLNKYPNACNADIFLERIRILEKFSVAWHSSNESRFIRFGFFIGFLLGAYLFMWYSIFLNKPIEYCIYKYAKFNLTIDPNILTEVETGEKKSIGELTKKDLVKLNADGQVLGWSNLSKKESINIYKKIRNQSESSDADCLRKTTEQFEKKFGHITEIAPTPNSIYKWLNY